jgi:peptidoglycan/LPS O-acetylase OafA/YrhL
MTSIDTEPGRAHLPSLTSLRFFAALVVLMRHTVPDIYPLPGLLELSLIGPIGVGFFFVLSGFILTWTWKPLERRRYFYMRRVARIVPLHVLTTVVAAALLISAGTPLWLSTLVSLFLLQAWLTEPFRLGGNSPSWSLSVEAFFYALFPFIVRPLSRLSIRRCASVILAAGALMAIWTIWYAVASKAGVPFLSAFSGYTNPVYRLGEFVIGVALAFAMRQGWRLRLSAGRAVWIAIGSYVALAALNATVIRLDLTFGGTAGLPLSVLDLIYLPVTVMLVAAAAGADLDGKRSPLRGTALVRLGEWSFALYLVQAIVIGQAMKFVSPETLSVQNAAVATSVAVVSVVLSAALFHWFEKPIEGAWKRKQRALTAAAGPTVERTTDDAYRA